MLQVAITPTAQMTSQPPTPEFAVLDAHQIEASSGILAYPLVFAGLTIPVRNFKDLGIKIGDVRHIRFTYDKDLVEQQSGGELDEEFSRIVSVTIVDSAGNAWMEVV